jgi:hypothetical protein
MAREDELSEQDLKDAMAATEQEIADEAFNDEPLENDGDRSLEEMEDETEGEEPQEGDEPEEAEAEGDEEGGEDDADDEAEELPQAAEPPARDPRTVALREERGRRQALERQLAELQGRLAERQAIDQPKPQATEKPAKPDMFADPEGWEKATRAEILAEANKLINDQRTAVVDESMAEAKAKHGDVFDAAYQALIDGKNDPATFAAGRRILASRDPGEALMKWHQQQQVVRDIGNDPLAYREKLKQEIMAELNVRPGRARASAERPQNVIQPARRMPSLNGTAGGSSHRGARDPNGLDDSQEAFNAFAFGDR